MKSENGIVEGDVKKFILKSKTIWGAILAALPTLAVLFGMNISTETLTDLNSIFNQFNNISNFHKLLYSLF